MKKKKVVVSGLLFECQIASHRTLSEHVRCKLCGKNLLEFCSDIRSTLCERHLPEVSNYIQTFAEEGIVEKRSTRFQPGAFNDDFIIASDTTQTKHLKHVTNRPPLGIHEIFLYYLQLGTIRMAEDYNFWHIENFCSVQVFGIC